MSFVEDRYQEVLATWSPAKKMARAASLNAWAKWNVARQITARFGELPPEVLKWRIALWVYGNNPNSRALIEEQLARVSA
jgi:hypothetical protein